VPQPFRAVILGDAPPGQEGYAQSLRRLIRETAAEDLVTMRRGVPMESLRSLYCRATVHVNLTPAGFGDKVALEGMSCGRPVVVANDDFHETLGVHADRLLFSPGDARSLAGRLAWLLSRPDDELDALGADLGARVRARHSLDGLADRIVGVLAEVA
jgi:mannosyltransferase